MLLTNRTSSELLPSFHREEECSPQKREKEKERILSLKIKRIHTGIKEQPPELKSKIGCMLPRPYALILLQMVSITFGTIQFLPVLRSALGSN
jgi:hypothetical protein